MELSIFRFHRWWFQTAGKGEEQAPCLGDCCSASQPGGSRLRRPSIVVRRMETFTQPDSILPARSWWQHADKHLLNQSQRVCCLFLSDQKLFSAFWMSPRPIFKQQLLTAQTVAHSYGPNGSLHRGSFDLIRPLCPLVSCRKFCSLCRKRRRAKTFFFFFKLCYNCTWMNLWVPLSHHGLSTCVTGCGQCWPAVSVSPPTASIPQNQCKRNRIRGWTETMAMTRYHSSDSPPQQKQSFYRRWQR